MKNGWIMRNGKNLMDIRELESLFYEAIEDSKSYHQDTKRDNILLAIAYGLEHIAKELEMERLNNGRNN